MAAGIALQHGGKGARIGHGQGGVEHGHAGGGGQRVENFRNTADQSLQLCGGRHLFIIEKGIHLAPLGAAAGRQDGPRLLGGQAGERLDDRGGLGCTARTGVPVKVRRVAFAKVHPAPGDQYGTLAGQSRDERLSRLQGLVRQGVGNGFVRPEQLGRRLGVRHDFRDPFEPRLEGGGKVRRRRQLARGFQCGLVVDRERLQLRAGPFQIPGQRSGLRRVGAQDRREAAAQRRQIPAGLGLGDEPGVELAGAAEGPQPVAVLAHQEIGGVDVAEVVDEQAVGGGRGGGGHLRVHPGMLEQLAVEADGSRPFTGSFGRLTGLPQDGGRGRGLGVQPGFNRSESLGRAPLRQPGLQDGGNRRLGLVRGGFVGGDLVVERVCQSGQGKPRMDTNEHECFHKTTLRHSSLARLKLMITPTRMPVIRR